MEISAKRRCIFCMEELNNDSEKCPKCGKSPWEYQWQNKFLPPRTVLKDKYTIGTALGNGGYGITYIGFDTVLEQRVAIKEFFPANSCSRSEDLSVIVNEADSMSFNTGRDQFKDEAALIFGSFDIPGICNIKDYFEENNTAYIVEEFLPGGTLDDALKAKKSFNSEEVLKIFLPVINGLNKIHSLGIIHMDISPDNLMFDADGCLKLIDFGAAKQLTSGNEETALKQAYAPPEQYNNPELIGPWTDLYSLCAVIYQTLTGTRPDPAFKRINKDTLKPAADIANVDFKLSAILSQGLFLDIRKRFFSCSGILEKLEPTTEISSALTGKIRHLWGERWLTVVTEQVGNFENLKEKKLTKHRIKKFLNICIIIVLLCGILTGATALYIKIAPESYFDFKLNRAIAHISKEEPFVIKKDSKLYKKVMDAAIPLEWSETMYDFSEPDLKKLGLISEEHRLSYLDKATVLKIAEYYIGEPMFPSSYVGTRYYASIHEKDDPNDSIAINAYSEESYEWTPTDSHNKITIKSDVVSERVMEISITANKKTCHKFLKNVFPYIIPETYLTDEEVDQIIDYVCAEDSGSIFSHPKFSISGFMSGDSDNPKHYITITRGHELF